MHMHTEITESLSKVRADNARGLFRTSQNETTDVIVAAPWNRTWFFGMFINLDWMRRDAAYIITMFSIIASLLLHIRSVLLLLKHVINILLGNFNRLLPFCWQLVSNTALPIHINHAMTTCVYYKQPREIDAIHFIHSWLWHQLNTIV